jgi:hypothetical protein
MTSEFKRSVKFFSCDGLLQISIVVSLISGSYGAYYLVNEAVCHLNGAIFVPHVHYKNTGYFCLVVGGRTSLVLNPTYDSRFAPFHGFEQVKKVCFFPLDNAVPVNVKP